MVEIPASQAHASRSAASVAGILLLLLGAAAAVFLAGGPQEGNMGVFLAVAGIALIACPPQARVDWTLWALAAGLVLCGALALAPQTWFPKAPWRLAFEAQPAIPLADSLSVAPAETRFWLSTLAVTLAVGLFALAHPVQSRARLIFAAVAALLCTVYAGLAIYAERSGWSYPFDGERTFGFFPNTNHTGTLLVTGSMLALGILGVSLRKGRWAATALAASCLSICTVALVFFSQSRGGIVFLAAGGFLWLIGLGSQHRTKPLVISFGAIVAAAIALFLVSETRVRSRILSRAGVERVGAVAPSGQPEIAEPKLDARILIFQDTLRMIRDFPVSGSGLGTFRYAFPHYRQRFLSQAASIHPESDWLLLAAEGGLPMLALVGCAVLLLLRGVRPLRAHPYWPLRWGILCAALAAALHGFMDVPVHRAALGWWVLVLAGGIGFQRVPAARRAPSRIQHALFVTAGFGALWLGVQLVRAEWFGGRHTAPFAAQNALAEIVRLRESGRLEEAVEAAREAIRASPVAHSLYFQLGVALLHFETTEAEVDAVFHAQRTLNPDWPQVPIDQGRVWINIDPVRAASLWSEAVARRGRIDSAQGGGKSGSVALFRDLLGSVTQNDEMQRSLLEAAPRDPAFTLAWLETATPTAVAPEAVRLAGDEAFLAGLDDSGRRRFLLAWYRRGDRPQLAAFLANHPALDEAAWPVRVRQLAAAGKFEDAVKSVALRHKIRLDLPPRGVGEAKPGPVDEANLAAAFDTYWRRENVVAARRIVEEARRGAGSRDPEVWRLSAALAVEDGQWQAAWQYLERWMEHSGLDSLR